MNRFIRGATAVIIPIAFLLVTESSTAEQACNAKEVMQSYSGKISEFSHDSQVWKKKWSENKVRHPAQGQINKDWVSFCMGGGLADGAKLVSSGNETWVELGNRLQIENCQPQDSFNKHGDRVLSLNEEVKKLKAIARCDDRG